MHTNRAFIAQQLRPWLRVGSESERRGERYAYNSKNMGGGTSLQVGSTNVGTASCIINYKFSHKNQNNN